MDYPHKFYLEHMNSRTGYRATWDPGKPLKLGYVGKLDKSGVFNVYSSLEKVGITPEVVSDTSAIEMDYSSHNGTEIKPKLSGSAPVAGSVLTNVEAGINVAFKNENGIVFQTAGHKTNQIVNLADIEKHIIGKYNDGTWEKDWLIITELVEADTSTIIISSSKDSSLDLRAKAEVGTQNLKLTDASLGLAVANEKGSVLKYIAQQGLTPLYRVMGIRHPLFGKTEIETKGTEEKESESLLIQDFDPKEIAE